MDVAMSPLTRKGFLSPFQRHKASGEKRIFYNNLCTSHSQVLELTNARSTSTFHAGLFFQYCDKPMGRRRSSFFWPARGCYHQMSVLIGQGTATVSVLTARRLFNSVGESRDFLRNECTVLQRSRYSTTWTLVRAHPTTSSPSSNMLTCQKRV